MIAKKGGVFMGKEGEPKIDKHRKPDGERANPFSTIGNMGFESEWFQQGRLNFGGNRQGGEWPRRPAEEAALPALLETLIDMGFTEEELAELRKLDFLVDVEAAEKQSAASRAYKKRKKAK